MNPFLCKMPQCVADATYKNCLLMCVGKSFNHYYEFSVGVHTIIQYQIYKDNIQPTLPNQSCISQIIAVVESNLWFQSDILFFNCIC